MNWIVYHIASGHSFFSGLALVMVAVALAAWNHPVAKRLVAISLLVGLIAILVSSTAIAYWYYGVMALTLVVWLCSPFKPEWRRKASIAVIVSCVVAAALELPYHLTPRPSPTAPAAIAVIGDSVTAGVGSGDSQTWPKLLSDQRGIAVQDISHMGDTAASALKRAKKQSITAPLVFIEIGGNDLLGTTSAAEFERDLDALLTHLRAPNRQLLMLELPLPPFCHEYGRVQRKLARQHQVKLIPKRVFLNILAGNEATLDTIHLSQAGHERMAECVWQLIQPAFPKHKG